MPRSQRISGLPRAARAKRKEKWTTTPNHTHDTPRKAKNWQDRHISPTPTSAPQGEPHRQRTRKRRKRPELENVPSATFHLRIDKLGSKTRVRSPKGPLYGQIPQWRNAKFAGFWHTNDAQKPVVIKTVRCRARPPTAGQNGTARPEQKSQPDQRGPTFLSAKKAAKRTT